MSQFSAEEFFDTHAETIKTQYDVANKEKSLARVLDFFGSLKNKTILDLGGGQGHYAILFAKELAKKVVVADASEQMLRLGEKHNNHPNIEWIHGKTSNLNIQDNTYDFIFSAALWHYLSQKDREDMLNIAHRISKKNAKLILTYPNPPSREGQHDLSLKDTENEIKDSGLWNIDNIISSAYPVKLNKTAMKSQILEFYLTKLPDQS